MQDLIYFFANFLFVSSKCTKIRVHAEILKMKYQFWCNIGIPNFQLCNVFFIVAKKAMVHISESISNQASCGKSVAGVFKLLLQSILFYCSLNDEQSSYSLDLEGVVSRRAAFFFFFAKLEMQPNIFQINQGVYKLSLNAMSILLRVMAS